MAYTPSADLIVASDGAYSPSTLLVTTTDAPAPPSSLTYDEIALVGAWSLDILTVEEMALVQDWQIALLERDTTALVQDWQIVLLTYDQTALVNGYFINPNELRGGLPTFSLEGWGYADINRVSGQLPVSALAGFGGATLAAYVPFTTLTASASGEWGYLSGSLPLTHLAGNGAAVMQGRLPTQTLAATSPDLWGLASGALPGFSLTAHGGVDGRGALPGFALDTAWAVMGGFLPAFTLNGTGLTGSTGHLAGRLPGLSGQAFGAASLEGLAPRFGLVASATTGGVGRMAGALPSFSLYSSATSEAVARGAGMLPLFSLEWGRMDAGTLPSFRLISAPDLPTALGVETDVRKPVNWCVNLKTGEMTSYTHYPFKRIVRFQGQFYGVSATGLYRLTGSRDNGAPIDVTLETAPMDFDSMLVKRVPYLYLGLTAGAVKVTTITDGVENGPYTGELGHKRVHLSRGAKGRYWGFRLVNVKGGPFRLDNLEIKVEPTTRRV